MARRMELQNLLLGHARAFRARDEDSDYRQSDHA